MEDISFSNLIMNKFTGNQHTLDSFHVEINSLIGFCQKYHLQNPIESVCVAVSGGSDSMALLTMTIEWARRSNTKVNCVTVDHKLREKSAEEAEHVGNFCKSLGVNHTILHWNRSVGIKHGKLESRAREARYQLISEFCNDKDIPVLLVGHTWNDQLETFEMRKNTGSSSIGLAGMSQVRSLTSKTKLLRPILHFTKNHLEKFLENQNIVWKVDPMNSQDCFKRVSFRKKIAHYDNDRVIHISNKIIGLGQKRNTVETAAVNFFKKICKSSKNGIIEKKQLLSEDKAVQMEILRRVIWCIGEKKYAPTITEAVYNQILYRKINTIGNCLLKVKKNEIFVFKENRRKSHELYAHSNYKVIPEITSLDEKKLFDIFL
ncbi:MAG: tRNA lysidine(34) synthetase TilS [Holosporaceae bacterium]|nr:tRNA lysidine(34) synthetase TilS [Holosporaceae bacterium]